MGARTTAREAALQMLYALEAGGAPSEQVIRDFWRELPGDAEGRAYADEIVRGVHSELEQTDERIRAASRNWRLERIGAWELLRRPDVPRAVILDEAVELAKRYGASESSAFVNGVLDRIADDCGRADGDGGPDGSTEGSQKTG
jgi:N utilization substance protein B